jgi:hypothetical protein
VNTEAETSVGRKWALDVLQEARDRVLALMDRNKGDVFLGLFGAVTHLSLLADEVRLKLWDPTGRVPVNTPVTQWFLVRVLRRADHYMLYTTFRESDPSELLRKLREYWYPENEYDVSLTELPGYELVLGERGSAVLVERSP